MSTRKLKKYILHWLNGKTEEIEGYDIKDAFAVAGYGGGSIRSLDYWEEKEKYKNDK